MESHNHPSFIEPFQGAATGVGGILRDIFTMGARPIACLNSLRFGDLDNNRNRFLLEHVVEGIADYGNCVSASIPLALSIAIEEKQLQNGNLALMIGTGAGLSIASAIIKF